MKVTGDDGSSTTYCDGDECTAIHPPGLGDGWETYLNDEDEILIYCPACAAWWRAEEAAAVRTS